MKPEYHQSSIGHYYMCPHKSVLAREYQIPTTMPMRDGLLFEFFVFGMNPRASKIYTKPEDYSKYLIGKKHAETIDPIKQKAQAVIERFQFAGEPFQELRYESKYYVCAGEADFIGELQYKDQRLDCIADLKFTANIASWREYTKASDYFQALYYTYILWKNTGKILPFLYIIVDSGFDIPVIGTKLIRFNKDNYKQLKADLDFMHHDIIKRPVVSENTCIKGAYNKRCDYLQWCEAGREFLEDHSEIEFDELTPDFLTTKKEDDE